MGRSDPPSSRPTQAGYLLSTPTGRGQFEIAQIDDKGIVLLLGASKGWTPLRWDWIEAPAGRDLL